MLHKFKIKLNKLIPLRGLITIGRVYESSKLLAERSEGSFFYSAKPS